MEASLKERAVTPPASMWAEVVDAVVTVGTAGLILDQQSEVFAVPTFGGVEGILAMGAGCYASYNPVASSDIGGFSPERALALGLGLKGVAIQSMPNPAVSHKEDLRTPNGTTSFLIAAG
jgi:hypothetical protein